MPASTDQDSYDTLVVGAGVVGMSIAYGLASAGQRVQVLDEGDDALRASRGNFGLVWVQGKGAGHPPYARWTIAAAAGWPAFAQELRDASGVDVELSQPGGLTLCLDEAELRERAQRLSALAASLPQDNPFEVLDAAQVRRMLPQVGPAVAGAVAPPRAGPVSPLRLLRPHLAAVRARGGRLACGQAVRKIEARAGEFVTHLGDRRIASARVVLAAGLGSSSLAPSLGLRAPLKPVRGQLLITERVQPFLRHPTLHVRQTGEGTVQIGDSKEDAGYDDGTTLQELSRIAARAVRCFPLLAHANIVRTWGALRVMTPDGLPIYEASREYPGAYLATCHSGITLAPQHADAVAAWIAGGPVPAGIDTFTTERFHVQAA